jgi:HNH endonuclease
MNRSNLETMISSWNQLKVPHIYLLRSSQIPKITGTLSVTDEVPVTRITSHVVTGRENTFRAAVRERDKKCVITGLTNSKKNIARNEWDRFEAAYVFPLASESLFIRGNLPRWITLRAPTESGINSVQNALLLRVDVHRLFDQYLISINPDVSIFRRPFLAEYVVLI